VKAYDEIRRIFASQPLARERRFTPGTFSFNVSGGRCETCEGAGVVQIEMVFMADVFVPCETCGGRRFKPDVLEVTVRNKTIYDVLQLTVDQAIRFFAWEEKLGQALWQLQQVGLGYLRLGQSATTLSGGEAQRIKIARELTSGERKGVRNGQGRGAQGRIGQGRSGQGRSGQGRSDQSRRIYIMDEPTTGLHIDDIKKLSGVLDRLLDAGHTLVVIEHNLDVIKLADWVIDLGPEAGDRGGEVVAMGRPEEIARNPRSITGQWLAPLLPEPTRRELVSRDS
jgi:excinuclease ABC subunit A